MIYGISYTTFIVSKKNKDDIAGALFTLSFTGSCRKNGTIFSQYLFNPDIFEQLSAASLTEVLLTQFSWAERVG